MWIRLLFLAVALTTSSGFRFRCYWLCTDQTGIQDDYVEQRDQCRQFAQLKYSTMISNGSGEAVTESRDAALVRLFSECMASHGWAVPSGVSERTDASRTTSLAPTTPFGQRTTTREERSQKTTTTFTAVPPPATMDEKAALTRHAECDFARESAPVSHIAAQRAEACDLECANALKANPTGPLPAACPSDYQRPATTTVTTHETKTVTMTAPPAKPAPKPKPVRHAIKKPRPVAAPAQPAPKPVALPSPVLPPIPVPVVTAPAPASPPAATPPEEATSVSSLLSGLLWADVMLFFILLALYIALRLSRRRHTPPAHPRTPSLSAKIRGRSKD